MSNYERLCFLLLDINDGLLIDLRFGKGINHNKANEILEVLLDIKNNYKNSDVISKELCNLFIDFYPFIDGSLSLYSIEEVHEILEISDKILDAMRACVEVEN